MPVLSQLEEVCTGCLMGKQTRKSFPSQSKFSATAPLELVHSDLCGPITPCTSREEIPCVDHIHVFGYITLIKEPNVNLKKLDNRSRTVVHLGKEPGVKAHRLLDTTKKKIHVSRDILFEERKPWDWNAAEESHTLHPGNFPVFTKHLGGEIDESNKDPENSLDAHGETGETDKDYVTSPHNLSSSQIGDTTPSNGSGSEIEEQLVKYKSLGDIYDSI
ncbi:hypothetical protein AgCh_038537 [Apium graveolens]